VNFQATLRRRLRALQPTESSALLILAVALGLASGICIWLFRRAVELTSHTLTDVLAHDVLGQVFGIAGVIIVAALGGLIVGWMMERFIGEERHKGMPGIIAAVALAGGRLRFWRMPIKTLASVLSLGAGASLGAEAPSVQIGANLGSMFGQKLRLSEDRVRLLVAAGSASAIAAAFRAPIAGVFFALEIILSGDFTVSSFGVVVLSAVVSSVFTQAVEIGGPELGALSYTLGGPLEVPFYVLLGLLLAPIAVLFIRTVFWQERLWHRIHLSRPLKTALAGVLMGVIGVFLPQLLGTGRDTMIQVLTGERMAILLLIALGLVKILAAALSISGGFVGGLFAPTLFVGTMLGGAFGALAEQFAPSNTVGDPAAYAIAGMAAMLAGVVRSPITAIVLVFELTNDYHLILPIMLTTVICVFLTERFEPLGIELRELAEKGIRLQQGRDVDVMQSVLVREAMVSPAPTIHEQASLVELRDTLRRDRIRAAAVVDDSGELVGIVTLTDLQKAYESGDGDHLTVSDIATRSVVTAAPDEPVWMAVRQMGARDIGRLPVLKAGTRIPIGMLSRHDIMRAYNTAIARKAEVQHAAEQMRLHTLTGAHVVEYYVVEDAPVVDRKICEIEWPAESVVASIRRGERLIVPRGDIPLRVGDTLTIVAAPEVEDELGVLTGQIVKSR
jgi:CIC family chloride channel protein